MPSCVTFQNVFISTIPAILSFQSKQPSGLPTTFCGRSISRKPCSSFAPETALLWGPAYRVRNGGVRLGSELILLAILGSCESIKDQYPGRTGRMAFLSLSSRAFQYAIVSAWKVCHSVSSRQWILYTDVVEEDGGGLLEWCCKGWWMCVRMSARVTIVGRLETGCPVGLAAPVSIKISDFGEPGT